MSYSLPTQRFLHVLQPEEHEPETEFTERVQQSLALALKVQSTNLMEADVAKWLAGKHYYYGTSASP